MEASSRSKPLQAWDRLVETAKILKILRSLSGAEVQRVADVIEVLTTIQVSERRKKYKRFLYDVLRNSGPQVVLLCAVALGQGRVVDMKSCDRAGLSYEIKINKEHPDINHQTLQLLAISYQIPNSVADLPLPAIIEPPREQNQTATETEPQDLVQISVPVDKSTAAETQALESNLEAVLPMQHIGAFAGRVFQLTIEDARAITMSDQV